MKPKIQILGNGAFGVFLTTFLASEFEIVESTERDHQANNQHNCPIILAVPLSALKEVAKHYKHRPIINVCSVQQPSNKILRELKCEYIGIHYLFGFNTPKQYYNCIVTANKVTKHPHLLWLLEKNCRNVTRMSAVKHDTLMSRTHTKAVNVIQRLKSQFEKDDFDDVCVPHSYRRVLHFVRDLPHMSTGTIQTVLANKYR